MLTPASKGTTSATKGGSGGSRRTLKRQHSMTATSPPPRPVAPDNQDGLLCVPSLSVSSQHHDSSMTFGSSTLQLRIIDLTSDVAGKDDVINILRDQLAECQEQLETAKQQRKQAERAGEEHRISNELASAKLTVRDFLLSVSSSVWWVFGGGGGGVVRVAWRLLCCWGGVVVVIVLLWWRGGCGVVGVAWWLLCCLGGCVCIFLCPAPFHFRGQNIASCDFPDLHPMHTLVLFKMTSERISHFLHLHYHGCVALLNLVYRT